MTNELEKTFFDTFGIEPNTRYRCIASQPCAHTGYHCKGCTYHSPDSIYPQITDRILLELICINNKNVRCIQELIVPRNLKLLKKSILRRLIENSKISFHIKRQVQALFEEG